MEQIQIILQKNIIRIKSTEYETIRKEGYHQAGHEKSHIKPRSHKNSPDREIIPNQGYLMTSSPTANYAVRRLSGSPVDVLSVPLIG